MTRGPVLAFHTASGTRRRFFLVAHAGPSAPDGGGEARTRRIPANGAPWEAPRFRPAGWDLEAQLRQVPPEYR